MIQYLLYSLVLFYYLPPFSLKQMAGDRKGKAKVDEQPKKKKRSREERGWERAHRRSCCRSPSEAVQDLRVPGSYRGGVRARCTDSSRHSDFAPFCTYPGPSSDPTCSWWSSSPWVDALRGLEAALIHSQTGPGRQRISLRVRQRISLGTGQCF